MRCRVACVLLAAYWAVSLRAAQEPPPVPNPAAYSYQQKQGLNIALEAEIAYMDARMREILAAFPAESRHERPQQLLGPYETRRALAGSALDALEGARNETEWEAARSLAQRRFPDLREAFRKAHAELGLE